MTFSSGLRARILGASLAAIAFAAAPAFAQDIVIGHVAPYTGPLTKDANDTLLGAKVAIEAANAHGGVLGRKIRIVTADDHYKVEETAQLIGSMVGKVSALLPMIGSANIEYVMKQGTLDRAVLPVVGLFPSPDFVRNSPNRNLFHIRAGDRDQLNKIIEQLTSVGITQIGIIAPKTPFGASAAAVSEELLEKHKLKLLARGDIALGPKIDFEPALNAVSKKNLAAILVLTPPTITGPVVKQLRERGETAMIFAMSYSDAKLVVKVAGKEFAHGVAIAQIMPNPANRSIPIVKAFREDWDKYSGSKDEPSFFNIEGYISGRLIVEAIRRSKDSSPEGVRRGLEMLKNYDLGGYNIDFGPGKHIGSTFVDLSVIGASGNLMY